MDRFGPIRVLVVDDDPGVATLIGDFLTRDSERFDVRTVTDPEEALETARTDPPDCVVSDYDMPRIDGLELLEMLREEFPNLPFILFTGKDTETVGPIALERGVSRYLQKGSGTAHFALLASDITGSVETMETVTKLQRQVEAAESAPEGICIVDEDGEIEYVNDLFLEMHGYDREALIGRSWEVLHPDEEVARVYREVLPTLSAAGQWDGEATGQRRSGETFEESETIRDLPSGGFVIFASQAEGNTA
jgi:PAS domain S-box-containing protein